MLEAIQSDVYGGSQYECELYPFHSPIAMQHGRFGSVPVSREGAWGVEVERWIVDAFL
jgi:hypothetical protein